MFKNFFILFVVVMMAGNSLQQGAGADGSAAGSFGLAANANMGAGGSAGASGSSSGSAGANGQASGTQASRK